MKFRAAVIGHPVHHSLSPAIFGFLANSVGEMLSLRYEAIDVEPSALSRFIDDVRSSKPSSGPSTGPSSGEWLGFNVTLPHKESIAERLDQIHPAARAVGAVNVVHRRDGVLEGHNTDVFGIIETLREHAVNLKTKNVLVIGAGGAARAAAYACATEGASRISVFNRSQARVERLIEDLSPLFPETSFETLSGDPSVIARMKMKSSLVIQSTPAGMSGYAANEMPEWQSFLEPADERPFAFDLIYRPERTPFLATAEERGYALLGGLDMLIYQALATWDIWLGPLPNRAAMKTKLVAFLREQLKGRAS